MKPLHSLVVAVVVAAAVAGCTSQPAAPRTTDTSTRLHQVFAESEGEDYPHVKVWGFVRNPGVYRWQPGMTVGDLIRAAGGTSPLAAGIRMRHDAALVTYLGVPEPDDRLWRESLRKGEEIDVVSDPRLGEYLRPETSEHQPGRYR